MANSAVLLSTDELQKLVLQTAHGFGVGDVLRFDGADYVLAQADSEDNAAVVGMVSAIADANHFWISQIGYLSNLENGPYVAGDVYYLSPITPGTLTNVKPTTIGQVEVPCFIPDSTNTGFWFANVGDLIAGDDIGANTSLSNLITTSINQSLTPDNDLSHDLGTTLLRWNNLYSASLRTGQLNGNTLTISARDVDGASYVPFITLTAGNNPTCVLNGNITSVTQTPGDNSTKLATTAYADAAAVGGGANKALSNLSAVAINTSLLPGADNSISLGDGTHRTKQIFSAGLTTGTTAADTLIISARDIDGTSDTAFITLTANNTPTASFSGDITSVTQAPNDNSTKLATTAYADAAAAAVAGANTALSNLASVAINTTLVSDTDVTDNLGTQAIRWNNIYSATLQTGDSAADTLEIGAWDVDGAAFTPFITLTANNTPTCALSGDVTAVTQTGGDNSTKLATTAYVDSAIPVVGANQALSNLVAVAVNTTLVSDTDVTDDLGTQAIRWRNVYTGTIQTGDTAADTLQIGAWDVDGAAFVPFFTLTANNTPTGVLASGVTGTTQAAADNSTKLATTAYADAAAAAVVTYPIALSKGGTNANLTASNGGIFYSTATAGAILAGTATANQMLQSGASTTPAWSTATYPATTTINQLLYSSSANTVVGLATANSSILVTSAGGVPSLSTTVPNGVIATTQAALDNSTKLATTAYVDAAVTASAMPWTTVTGTTQAVAINNGYVANNAGAVTLTLPGTAAVGSQVIVTGLGAGGWVIAQPAGVLIHIGNQVTTTGVTGSLASTNRYDTITLRCIVADTTWTVVGSQGNITYV